MTDSPPRPALSIAYATTARGPHPRPTRSLEALAGEPAGSRSPIVRELNAAADYLRFLRQEIARLGADEIAKERIPVAIRELECIVDGTEKSSNAIMGAAEEVIAGAGMAPEAYKAFVAEKMTAIFVACAFQDLASQRARRIQSTLQTMERRLSRLATMVNTRHVPDLVDFTPAADEVSEIGPAFPDEANDQQRVDEIFEEHHDIDWK
ncbi:hypothetical protein SLNSH_12530 [Alsobacter soli]|uniref:Chemotaxis protein CheZ n=1 Tax=Alsobacter soli TaxID=2109933 RepID=A0A2T1HSG5_9HYPH|nr:hypothetical protein [Alsobacter soli]PSC04600.1 hypothetical protein SLNSH_12530 [Alsobacter soli]